MNAVLRRTITVVVSILIVAAALMFAARIPRTISIFLIAAFIAFGAWPIVRRLERRMPRPLATALVYVGLLGALVLLALVVVPITYGQIAELLTHAPEVVAGSEKLVGDTEHLLRRVLGNRVPMPSYADIRSNVALRVNGVVAATFAQLGPFIIGAVSSLLVGTSALILSVFFLLQGRQVRDGILAFVPPSKRGGAGELLHELSAVFGHFVAGQALLCAIVGGTVWILLAPAHFPFALLVAVICAIGYAVPFVGMLVAQVVGALLAIPEGTGMIAWVSLVIFVVARVADNVLVPKIMAESVGVSPITVMFAVFAGGELFGVPGLVLGIPAAALLKVLFGYFVQPYVVRMQQRDLETHHLTAENVHVDVSIDNEDGKPHPPETVTVTVSP